MIEQKLKLHLGCGKRFIPGFVHIDLADFPHIDYQHEIDSLPMFADNSVELIYCCHTFEYFDRQQAPAVLAEWHRVLRPGGVLRLAVPDFEALVQVYLRYGDLKLILGPLYGRWVVPSSQGEIVIYHRTVYDFKSLAEVLEQNGFHDVRRYDWRQTEHADYDDYSQAYIPHMDKEHGLLISLNVEAQK
jgi:predicted SAM-dependent methyltransferase